jgi:beta-galactosidase/beta-glucuronidase
MQERIIFETDPINFGWFFAEGDHPEAIQPGFDHSAWQEVDLPHDWAICQPFDPAGDPNTGKLPWQGEGWYRKLFALPALAKGQRLQFIFDGVMSHPTVYLNGQEVGSWIYGYNSFLVDATSAARFGETNLLTVHADTRKHQSRWYPGAGIYRKVSMRLVHPVHIPTWGVFVKTPQVSEAAALVQVEVELANLSGSPSQVEVESELVAPDGQVVTRQHRRVQLTGETGVATFRHQVSSPARWDMEHPHRYTAHTRLFIDGQEIGAETTRFGIRTFDWTADDGFHLNGRRVPLNGVNEHHTHGMLGAAFFPAAMERKLKLLRGMGVNALRTSHNPEAPEVLETCDRLGIIVFNELYDKWGPTAGVDVSTSDYVEQYAAREVRNFVRRDRNHPSVMLWSIANEDGAVLTDRDGRSSEHVARMVGFFAQHDDTRPTTMGCHISSGADLDKRVFAALDTAGWNYSQRYMNFRRNYPDRPIIYSETASAFATRGHYELKLPTSKTDYGDGIYQNAFVLTAAPWGDIPEHEFERMRKHNFLNGDFIWTGFDYLGEPTPYRGTNSPPESLLEARSSYFGVLDLAGLPKDSYYLYRSQWLPQQETVHLSPHWNWAEGDRVPVILYTSGDEAELFLNGRSLGRQAKRSPDDIAAANLAFGKLTQASSEDVYQDTGGNVLRDNTSEKAVDGNPDTRWRAADESFPQQFQVDLGETREFSCVRIRWEGSAADYQFGLSGATGEEAWHTLPGSPIQEGNTTTFLLPKTHARHLKLQIDGQSQGLQASLHEFEVLATDAAVQNPYYDIVDAYRIRFHDIPFAAGELKVVAYRDGQVIGQDAVHTAGPPSRLELSADRPELVDDGMDLSYVTIRMLDASGTLCPRAMNGLHFEVEGPVTFMGVANGDPMGMLSLTAEEHPLFYGQAVAVLRSKRGGAGRARLQVSSDNGLKAEIALAVTLAG